MKLLINNKFSTELPSDPLSSNDVRQVFDSCFSFVIPKIPSNPVLIDSSIEVGELIGLTESDLKSEEFLSFFSGTSIYPKTKPFAMCYGGHQFGNWAGQLGDGRAINLMEVENNETSFMLQLKGAGKTPYSRSADGLAVLRSSIREHLCSEAMHYLGVPTTRSLALFLSGDEVLRDVLYNGNPTYEKGAIVCRVAPSFIRFGNFEIFSARNDFKNLKLLTDFTIKNYFPEITSSGVDRYLHFFETVAIKTREMILHWQRVGFVHGVMNTDNMSIHGITIDFGPYGWLEDFDLNWTPNTTDNQHKRYRYGNQPEIALWNLYQLANALYPLINEAKPLEKILEAFSIQFDADFLVMMKNKLGFSIDNKEDSTLIFNLIATLQLVETDLTLFYRNLSSILNSDTNEIAFEKIQVSFYNLEEITTIIKTKWLTWFDLYLKRLQLEKSNDSVRKESMNGVNPKYVLRNYMAQLAIDAADKEDYSVMKELHQLLRKPYEEQPKYQKWFAKRPDWAKDKIGCSKLSCSS